MEHFVEYSGLVVAFGRCDGADPVSGARWEYLGAVAEWRERKPGGEWVAKRLPLSIDGEMLTNTLVRLSRAKCLDDGTSSPSARCVTELSRVYEALFDEKLRSGDVIKAARRARVGRSFLADALVRRDKRYRKSLLAAEVKVLSQARLARLGQDEPGANTGGGNLS